MGGRTSGSVGSCFGAWAVGYIGEYTIYFLDTNGEAYQPNVLAGREETQIRYYAYGIPLTVPTAYLPMRDVYTLAHACNLWRRGKNHLLADILV